MIVKYFFQSILTVTIMLIFFANTLSADNFPRLQVFHERGHPGDGHYIVTEEGKPFFYLGDTAWELFHRLNREEADIYFRTVLPKSSLGSRPSCWPNTEV